MNILLLGPPGAGKGTHAGELCSRYGLWHISTGDLLRRNLDGNSQLGTLARKYMARGELVPDEVVDGMIGECVRGLDPEKGMLFDGFPRTGYQAQFLDGLMKSFNRTLAAVVYLEVSDEEIVTRLVGRLTCRQCQTPYHTTVRPPIVAGACDLCGGQLYHRDDDTVELARARLRVFHRSTGPVIEHYMNAAKLIILNGVGSIPTLGARLSQTLDAVKTGDYKFATRQADRPISPVHAAGDLKQALARPSLDIVLLGGPGSGKGTQAEQLEKQLKLPHIATGDLFCDNLKNATDLGKLAKTYMDRGELVPDDVTESMVEERLARPDTRDGFILDGFPRTLPQAQALLEMMAGLQRRISG